MNASAAHRWLLAAAFVTGGSGAIPGFQPLLRLDWIVASVLVAVAGALSAPRLRSLVPSLTATGRALAALLGAEVLLLAVSAIWSGEPSAALREVVRAGIPLLVFAIALAGSEEDHALWRNAALAIATLQLTLGLVGIFGGLLGHPVGFVVVENHAVFGRWPRPRGTLLTPEAYAVMGLIAAGLLVTSSPRHSAPSPRTAATSVLSMLSLTVAGVASGVVALLWWAPRSWRRAVIILAVSVASLTVARVYLHPHEVRISGWSLTVAAEPGYEPRGETVLPLRRFDFGPFGTSVHATGYAALHAAALRTGLEHPLGIGAGRFEKLDLGPVLFTSGDWRLRADPHSLYLRRFAECGPLGGLLSLTIGIAIVAIVIRRVPDWLCSGALVLVALVALALFSDPLHRLDVALLAALLVRRYAREPSAALPVEGAF